MPGFAKPGPGRPMGLRNKATMERELLAQHGRESARLTGETPLDLLLRAMRGGKPSEDITERQIDCAKAAAPYMHPRLAAIAVQHEDKKGETPDMSTVPQEEREVMLRVLGRFRRSGPTTIEGTMGEGE